MQHLTKMIRSHHLTGAQFPSDKRDALSFPYLKTGHQSKRHFKYTRRYIITLMWLTNSIMLSMENTLIL